MKWSLMSYFYVQKNPDQNLAPFVRDNSDLVEIDSGAHSFQKGAKVDWERYTYQYADFIRQFDRPNVVGYFEMDVDNVIGYENVLKLREILERVTDKIIPVWHWNRGISDFKEMCKRYSGRVVAITGFKNEDIKDYQYPMFVKYAHDQGCRIHCLGMTRKKVLEKVPFDYTDSSSWCQEAIYGKLGKRQVNREYSSKCRESVLIHNYTAAIQMQNYFHNLWLNVNKDY